MLVLHGGTTVRTVAQGGIAVGCSHAIDTAQCVACDAALVESWAHTLPLCLVVLFMSSWPDVFSSLLLCFLPLAKSASRACMTTNQYK